jgi:hypothetical protein
MGGDGGAVAGRRLKYQELSSNQGRATHRDGLTTVRQQRGQRKGQG